MSGGEIIVIFLVMLLLFGSKKLPDLARTLGKGMHEFQKAKDEIQNELTKETQEMREDLSRARNSFQNEVEELKNNLSGDIDESLNAGQPLNTKSSHPSSEDISKNNEQ